jgi:glycosyltransferase involved in cell wall biosynthesis
MELSNLGVQVWRESLDEAKEYIKRISKDIVLAVAARPNNMKRYIEHFDDVLTSTPVIFDTVDLHFLRNEREVSLRGKQQSKRDIFSQAMDQAQEVSLMRLADLTLVVSSVERELMVDLDPSIGIDIVSNVHRAIHAAPTPSGRDRIVFVANFNHAPNVDGIMWFLNEVWPLVRKKAGHARLSIVGSPVPEVLEKSDVPGVEVLGWVEDLEPIYSSARVAIAPMRFGAGVKGKVGEAWGHGVPVVMTAIGAEGMDLKHGSNGLIADGPDDFADSIVNLIQDDVLWENISSESLVHVESTLGPQVFENAIDRILDKFGLIP